MKLLIVVPPFDDQVGKGVPPMEYQWMADLLEKQSFQVQLQPLGSCRELEQAISLKTPDLIYSPAFSTLEPSGDKPIIIHQILERLGLPYVGSTPEALELALSKVKLKFCLLDHGIATPDFYIFRSGELTNPTGDSDKQPAHYPYNP